MKDKRPEFPFLDLNRICTRLVTLGLNIWTQGWCNFQESCPQLGLPKALVLPKRFENSYIWGWNHGNADSNNSGVWTSNWIESFFQGSSYPVIIIYFFRCAHTFPVIVWRCCFGTAFPAVKCKIPELWSLSKKEWSQLKLYWLEFLVLYSPPVSLWYLVWNKDILINKRILKNPLYLK